MRQITSACIDLMTRASELRRKLSLIESAIAQTIQSVATILCTFLSSTKSETPKATKFSNKNTLQFSRNGALQALRAFRLTRIPMKASAELVKHIRIYFRSPINSAAVPRNRKIKGRIRPLDSVRGRAQSNERRKQDLGTKKRCS